MGLACDIAMARRRRRNRAVALSAGLALLISAAAWAAGEPKKFHIAGGDSYVWLVSSTGKKDQASQFPLVNVESAHRIGSMNGVPTMWRAMDPIVGNIRNVCADRDRLFLQLGGGSFSTISADGATPGDPLPSGTQLAAWAGDSTGDTAAAVVTVTPDLLSSAPSSKSIEAVTRLARFDGHEWTMLANLPDAAATAGEWKLAVHDTRLLLFWIEAAAKEGKGSHERVIRCIEWNKTGWGATQTVARRGSADLLAAGWLSNGPVLLVHEPKSATDSRLTIHAYERSGEEWQDRGAVRDGNQPVEVEPNGVTLALGGIMFARPAQRGGMEVGWAAVGPSASVNWLPLDTSAVNNPAVWQTWLSNLVMIAIFAFLFLLRPERLATPAKLPGHLTMALPLRRLIAGLIDLLPAIIVFFVTAIWWMPMAMEVVKAGFWQVNPEEMQALAQATTWARLLAISGYSLYCFVLEAITGTTPGKYIFGYHVVNENGARPTLRQIAIRNFVRIPELYFDFTILATLFLMVVASQRRQRIGDMLAGTIVVGHTVPQARPLRHPGGEGGSDHEDGG